MTPKEHVTRGLDLFDAAITDDEKKEALYHVMVGVRRGGYVRDPALIRRMFVMSDALWDWIFGRESAAVLAQLKTRCEKEFGV